MRASEVAAINAELERFAKELPKAIVGEAEKSAWRSGGYIVDSLATIIERGTVCRGHAPDSQPAVDGACAEIAAFLRQVAQALAAKADSIPT
jgi:hypothetical protein